MPLCDAKFFAGLGFFVIGLVSTACIAFGVYEIVVGDATFMNSGLGEVLTVLGLYFAIPYVIIVLFFISRVKEWHVSGMCENIIAPARLLQIAVVLLYVLQQCVTDAYLAILTESNYILLIILVDVVVLAGILVLQFEPVSASLYTILYAAKLALQWNRAYFTQHEAFFGPHGVSTMLFLCIPIIQFPLYTSAISARESAGVVDVFVENSNLFLSHLLHSLDTVAMYLFGFVSPNGSDSLDPCPAPLRWLLLVVMLIAFIANNLAVPYLFFSRRGASEVELRFLPKRIIEVTRLVAVDDSGLEGVDDVVRSRQRRMFQYMLLMLFACDVPFFFMRCELWRQNYFTLDVFVAKNLKDFVDVCMLLMRSDASRARDVGV